MCGIAGWLGLPSLKKQHAERLAKVMHHRGPDGYGIQVFPKAALVHTRLSIIDLSPAGAQPMANEDQTVWAVCNGEIYNHRELRRDLESRGHRFKGYSDAEILPHLYEEEGSSFVKKLKGMFALAIYDVRTQTFLLARDPFGIKPLFFAPEKEGIIFASEINALLEIPGIDVRPNRQAIFDYAALFYFPAPQTFYRGIQSLEPGKILEGKLYQHEFSWKTFPYHQWTVAPNPNLSLEDATDHAEQLLHLAVNQQLESDVALGSLLSGGIDSSLVSVAAQNSIAGNLKTFNVRFPEEEFDETWAAVEVANHIESQHTILDMENEKGTWENITGMLQHAGQPFADVSLFAVNAVSRLMKRYVTVALSGDGGDEGFGGYHLYWQIARIAQLQTLPVSIWRTASNVFSPLAKWGLVPPRLPKRIRDLTGADDTSIVQSMFSWLREEEHHNLCEYSGEMPVRRLFESQWQNQLPPKASRLERLSVQATEANTRLMLPNDFLFKVDTASMRHGLEIRVPMLDEDLFSFALTLPHNLKVKKRNCKRVLREVAKRKLPSAVANKPKLGFGIPVDEWVDKEFKFRLKEFLLGPSSQLPEYFCPKVYRPWIEAFCNGKQSPELSREALYSFSIMLLALELSLERKV